MSSVIVVSSLGQVFLAITQPYTGNRDGRPLWITGLATDAMRDAIWRKQTAARLEALTTANTLRSPSTAFGGCAEGADDRAKSALWTGLGARC